MKKLITVCKKFQSYMNSFQSTETNMKRIIKSFLPSPHNFRESFSLPRKGQIVKIVGNTPLNSRFSTLANNFFHPTFISAIKYLIKNIFNEKDISFNSW